MMMKTYALLLMTLLAALPGRAAPRNLETAIFAAGCFWCAQDPFDKVPGVVSTVVGYAGGKEKDPTYEMVSTGTTGYRESIKVLFDPAKVSYDQLLEVFWHHINPTQGDGQFSDHDHQYTTAIFYFSDRQKKEAEASRDRLARSGKFSKPIVTSIIPATTFSPAEEYHQKYYLKNPENYESYHVGSGRTDYLKRVWGSE